MNNPRGRIIAVESTSPAGHALVEVAADLACPRCLAGKGCGAGLLGARQAPRRINALIGTGVRVAVGDHVRLSLAPASLLRASAIVYGLPLVGAVLAALLAYSLGLGDLYAAVAALFGVLGGLVLARQKLKRSSCLRRFTPTVVERIALSEASAES